MIRLFARNAVAMPACQHLANVRFLSPTAINLDKSSSSGSDKSAATEQPATTEAGPAQAWQKKPTTSNLSGFDKRMLVWSGKYKSVDEVPPYVAYV